MSCKVASWIPDAVAATLRSESSQQLIAWLTTLRASIEEYDPLIVVRPPSAEPDDPPSESPDSAFDEILSQLGKEIFKLDQYQQNLVSEEKEVSLSILNIFDECLDQMGEKTETTVPVNGECSDSEMALSDKSYVTSTPCAKVNKMRDPSELDKEVSELENEARELDIHVSELNGDLNRTRLKTTSTSSSSTYDNTENLHDSQEWSKLIESESDSESTCWSYKECSDADNNVNNTYAEVWVQSSGFHNSDAILRHVLSQNKATVSRLSFDTVEALEAPQYPIYALREVGDEDRCVDGEDDAPVGDMTPERPCDDADGYEPVRDALTDENIYEEIEYGYSYTDEGCSCGTSVEVESCSISASSEGVEGGRESPLYANLRDFDAYEVKTDVIFWKNSLLDPFYCDDEEDEWITPEECAVYSREQRPPLVIPRITQCRAMRARNHLPYPEEAPLKSPMRDYGRMDYSPLSGRVDLERSFSKASSDSPPFGRLNKKFSGSTENILAARRPQHLNLPASSSGDSLDIEIRGDMTKARHGRKSHSVHVGHKHSRFQRSPVPAPRTVVPPPRQQPEASFQVIHEGTVKRTRFIENGKKCKKNWTECYMILTPTALMFYKDQKTYYAARQLKPSTPPSPTAPRLEMVLPLLNARVLPCKSAHTRRHNKSLLLTVDYDEYLIQDETERGNDRWLHEIQRVIYNLYPLMMNNVDSASLHPQSSNTDLESLGRTPPASRHKTKQKAGGSSNEDLSDSTENSIQKSHVKRRLRDFFARRPDKEVLMKKGYYKDEPVFGRNLEEVCSNSSPCVPEFVVACVKEIESSEENMCTDGLYRASGNLSQVQKIRLEIDQTSKNHLEVIKNNTDIHVLTGSLKLFFRELKEPLIPCNIFERILAACSLKPREVKIKEFGDIINSLPQCNKDTLKFLLEHLLRVTQHSERNRMHTANLAIVFGPTLLWAPADKAHNIAVDCIQQNNVVDILLNEFKDIFVEENSKGKKKA